MQYDIVDDRTKNDARDDRQNQTDRRNDGGFRVKDLKDVRPARADRAQNADLLLLVGDGNGNKIEQHQHGKQRQGKPYV